MIAALETARGKIPGARMLWLGTWPAGGAHAFEKMLTEGGADYRQIHAVGPDDNPFSIRSWCKANPGLDKLPDLLAVIRREAERAKTDGEKLASFRALRLNQGVADITERCLIEPGTWERLERLDVPQLGRYYLGVDLAPALQCRRSLPTGLLRAPWKPWACFPRIRTCLLTRGQNDGVGELYTRALDRGELYQAGDQIADVGQLMTLAWDRWGAPSRVVCDTWRERELRQALAGMDFTGASIKTRRQGWKDGAEDVRRFRNAALDNQIAPAPSILLRSALAEARTVMDTAGNEKITKHGAGRRRNARDDMAVAAVLAVGAGRRAAEKTGREGGAGALVV